jgi:hypothetical protein
MRCSVVSRPMRITGRDSCSLPRFATAATGARGTLSPPALGSWGNETPLEVLEKGLVIRPGASPKGAPYAKDAKAAVARRNMLWREGIFSKECGYKKRGWGSWIRTLDKRDDGKSGRKIGWQRTFYMKNLDIAEYIILFELLS